jgi:uncharacterized membrane protein YfcA
MTVASKTATASAMHDDNNNKSMKSDTEEILVIPQDVIEQEEIMRMPRSSLLVQELLPLASLALVVVASTMYIVSMHTSNNNDTSTNNHDSELFFISTSRRLIETINATTTTTTTKLGKFIYHSHHKDFFPLDISDWIGFACATLGLMVAAGGGIGGGGILVPIYILIMGFSAKQAIPLSNVTVLGGAIANTLLNARKRHPTADRPLMDWDLILVMEPLIVGGALIGAILNKLLPELLLIVMLVSILLFVSWTTLTKAVSMYKKENVIIQQHQASTQYKTQPNHVGDIETEETRKLLPSTNNNAPSSTLEQPPIRTREQQKILNEERTIPTTNVLILSAMFAVVLTVNILKGGGGFHSPIGIECGSRTFWLANAFMLACILLVTVTVRRLLIRKHQRKESCEYPYAEGDIRWDERATLVYPFICCSAGFVAGMFGLVRTRVL